jgi:chemotaxis response regulator CheB
VGQQCGFSEVCQMERVLRILEVDDFKEWRARVRTILQARPEWKIVSEACHGLEAVKQATELQPDIVLLELAMPTLTE